MAIEPRTDSQILDEFNSVFPKQKYPDRPKDSKGYFMKADYDVMERWLIKVLSQARVDIEKRVRPK